MDRLEWSDRPYLRWLTLFVSGGTLICCALPILLVTLGFGAIGAGRFAVSSPPVRSRALRVPALLS